MVIDCVLCMLIGAMLLVPASLAMSQTSHTVKEARKRGFFGRNDEPGSGECLGD